MKEKNDEFSTFDAVRILNMDRSRLVHWMRGEFIPLGKDKPWGRGFKTAFSLFDLYSIALFRECVDFSLSREVAKRYWPYVDWTKVIKEKLWLMAVKKKMGTFISKGQTALMYDWSNIKMLEEAPESASDKSTKPELPVAETAPKDSFLTQPIKLQSGEILIFKKNFQSLKKAEFKEARGFIFVIDLKSIVDEVNFRVKL
ncbi:hypothetical protein ACFL2S_04060 [Thermodesulfobacteriota bacterium]